MAIDSKEKRKSVQQMYPFQMLPDPDGTIGDADRIQAAAIYIGLLGAPPTTKFTNTECKRRSVPQLPVLTIAEVADGSRTFFDRRHSANIYDAYVTPGIPVTIPKDDMVLWMAIYEEEEA
jgi:hypothetical protein